MKDPIISVVLTTYNRKKRLKKAVNSVLSQTFTEFELIIVDDGSTDDTSKLVLKMLKKDERIKYLPQEKNFGQHTRPKNVGTIAAKGKYIAYLDDDNEYLPDHLQVLFNKIINYPQLSGVYGDRKMILDSDKHKGSKIGIHREWAPAQLTKMNYIDTSDVLIKKSDIEDVGGWDESLPYFADWNLWLRMAKAGKIFKRVPIAITKYFVHEGSNQIKSDIKRDEFTGLLIPPFDTTKCKIYPDKTSFGKRPKMKVAVFTLTYDRLDYTKKTIKSLRAHMGYDYDHYIVDNGSTDGTVEWLEKNQDKFKKIILNKKNNGISKASNQAIEAIKLEGDYDIIIKIDNDCQLLTQEALKKIVDIYESSNQFALSPYIEGLRDSPGGVPRMRPGGGDPYVQIGDNNLGLAPHLGGIFIATPADVYRGFRWEEEDFLHGKQDYIFSQYCLKQGVLLAYMEDIRAEHIDSTDGQEKKYKDYFKRRKLEKTTRYAKPNQK